MNKLLILSVALFGTAEVAAALDKVVTVEGPVQIVEEKSSPGKIAYFVEGSDRNRYKVIVPDTESDRFAVLLKSAPASVIQFDGTVTDNEAVPVLKVDKYKTVTTTTTTRRDGLGTTTVEERRVVPGR